MEKIIFHIDVNSAFLSWHCAYNKKINPDFLDLRKVASVIGGDEEARKGVVLAKSEEAKRYGIKTGISLFEAKRLCPNLVIAKPNFKIYRMYSNKMFELLSMYSDKIERFSIDEGFLDMSESIKLFGQPVEVAYKIKERIKKELGFSVNVGVSCNKLLAKMAGDLEKPDKVITLFPDELEEKLYPLGIDNLFMVGKKTKEKLNKLGINTIGELSNCSLQYLITHFKNSQGIMLYNYSHGIDDSKVEVERKIKSVGNSTTLSEDTSDILKLRKIILALCDSIGSRLRGKSVKGNVIVVTIKYSNFKVFSHRKTLSFYTSSTDTIYKQALLLFDELWNGNSVRLLGVSISGISENTVSQLSLIENNAENDKMGKVEKVMDKLRESYGKDIIKRGIPEGKVSKSIKDKWE